MLQHHNCNGPITNLSAKASLLGAVHQDVAVHVLSDEDTVWIELMNGTYAVVADTDTTVREYILTADSFESVITSSNLKVTTATINDGQRSITMERPFCVRWL